MAALTIPTTSYGCVLKRGDGGGSETFTTIGEITSFNSPSVSIAAIETTALDDSWKKYIGGIPDGGEIDIEYNFVAGEAQQIGLKTDCEAKTVRNWEIHLNDSGGTAATKFQFAGLVVSYTFATMAMDQHVKGRAKIKVSGAVTTTAAT